jgi:alkanesulfonate monooxygenase SsuD/methylene tetrahydromethanopterin reductase-like flavin-dependent oxidoreductase (luciferase family)
VPLASLCPGCFNPSLLSPPERRVYDVLAGSPDAAIRNGAQVPLNDPLLLVPAMANVTEHLGFGVTCTLSYEPPYTFARRISTLDHLTKGRIGWNIVTGYLNSAAKGLG